MPVHHIARTTSSADSASRSSSQCLHIGLINNMPDGALQATERQFLALLQSAAANDVVVQLSYFALPDVYRSPAGRNYVETAYADIKDLWTAPLDALIVTGTEPRSQNLRDEPYWTSLARVIDWAEHNTYSTVWSCLAAHAAVLQIDGVERRRLSDKRFGVFECTRVIDHKLTDDLPSLVQIPHSRWNDLAEKDLTDRGYQILTRTADGVDSFIKQRQSLFVFFQGHPEYEASTLLLEYRRDVGRYLKGESNVYPLVPQGYFDPETVKALAALRLKALAERCEAVLSEFPVMAEKEKLANTWSATATRFYANWLEYLCTAKAGRLAARRVLTPEPALVPLHEPR